MAQKTACVLALILVTLNLILVVGQEVTPYSWVPPNLYKFLTLINDNCTGAIVSRNKILTSAECVYNIYPNTVRPFAHDSTSETDRRWEATATVVHRFYNRTGYPEHLYNIAMLQTPLPMDFTKVIDLAPNGMKLRPNDRAKIVGWVRGHTRTCSAVPRHYDAVVVRSHICNIYSDEPNVCVKNLEIESRPCTGHCSGLLITRGDTSGSYMLHGIGNFDYGKPCDPHDNHHLFTSINDGRIRKWIEENLQDEDYVDYHLYHKSRALCY